MAVDLLTTIRAEIETRLSELAPLLAEYEELLSIVDALDTQGHAAPEPRPPSRVATRTARLQAPRPKTARPKTARSAGPAVGRRSGRSSIGPAGQAILAALEHGSHTVAELVVVTALPASDIRDDLRRLRKKRAIVKTDRDGKSAYALPA